MIIIVCLDDSRGMTFNKRRQSRDRAVLGDIAGMTEGKRLFAASYSDKLLSDNGIEHTVCDDMLLSAGQGDFCFVENRALAQSLPLIEEIVIYRWNRRYPADTYFDIDLDAEGFCLAATDEFEGYSHEKITKEIFRR